MLGGTLGRTINFESLTAKRYGNDQNFDLAPLRACRFITAGESDKRNPLNPAKIKRITGGDEISCSFKGRDHFTYRPMYKIWLASNWRVNTDVDDDAAWGRVKVIEFVQSHLDKPDTTLKHRMKQPKNLVCVLAWAVAGAVEWFENGLQEPSAIREANRQHREQLDTVGAFMSEVCTLSDSAYCVGATLHTAYKNWCDEQGFTPKKRKGFTQALERKGIVTKLKKLNGKMARCYIGIDTQEIL